MKRLNKKGFTLVELLAVIAILGILMLLVMPNVLSMFTSGRKNTFVNQVQRVWRTAEQQYMTDQIAGTTHEYYYNGCTGTNCGKLDFTDSGLSYCVHVNTATNQIDKIYVSDSNYFVKDATAETPKFDLKSDGTDADITAQGSTAKTAKYNTTTNKCSY